MWDIVWHFETLWNIVCQQICETSAGPSSPEGEYLKPFQLGFSTQNEFCHLQKTLMNRIYIAELNLKIFHQKDSFCKNVISKITFGRIFANCPGQNWAVEQFLKTMLTKDPCQRVSNHSSFEGRGEFLGKPHNKNYIVYLEGSLSFFVHIKMDLFLMKWAILANIGL